MNSLEFLKHFYRVMVISGLVMVLIGTAVGGWNAGLSTLLGALTIGFILWSWHITLTKTLGPHKTTTTWHTMVAYLHYALLGGLFYAMITLFDVDWPWYVAGSAIIVPGLLISVFKHDRDSKSS